MLPVISKRLRHWENHQEAYARQDLLVIDELARTSPALLNQDVISRIAKGEIRWETTDLPVADNLKASWTREPGGFVRLRMTYRFDAPENSSSQVGDVQREKAPLADLPGNGEMSSSENNRVVASNHLPSQTVTLVRRFSDSDIANSVGTGLIAMIITGVAGALVASATVFFRSTRKQELRWLRSIGSVLPSKDYRDKRPRIPFVSEAFAESVYTIADAMNQQIDEVRASYENSSRAMTNVPIGILSFDNLLQLEFINPAGRKLLQLTNAQEGKSLLEVVRTPILLDCLQETHRTGKPVEVEYERNADKLWLRLRTLPLIPLPQDADSFATTPDAAHDSESVGSGVPVLLTVIDESRLKQLENLRRDFTANVSHELKTPLAAIKAYSETLLMGAADDPEACKPFIERIGEQANRLDSLIRDLLQLTRLQSQPEKPKLVTIRLADVLKSAVEDHRPVAARKEIEWNLNIDNSINVQSDLEALKMIFNNLLSNAVRYNRAQGNISVSTRVEGRECIVSIADTGIGIPKVDIDRIFERFYRVEKARSQVAGGTGLGLAIVKHLAASIRATINVQSELGRGSEFKLRLPLTPDS